MGGIFIIFLILTAVIAAILFSVLIILSKSGNPFFPIKNKIVSVYSEMIRLVKNIKFSDLKNIRSFSDLVEYFKIKKISACESDLNTYSKTELDINVLNCRVQLTRLKEGNNSYDAFGVEMCGSIHTPDDNHNASLQISISDITEGRNNIRAVKAKVKQWQVQGSSGFSYTSDLGKLPHKTTILSDWTNVAQLRLDWLLFPREGKRILQFDISILSTESHEELTASKYIFNYDNPVFGYIDLQENTERTKMLAVALAFAVSAADGKLFDCEIEYIKGWARENIDTSPCNVSDAGSQFDDKAKRKLEKALDETIAFFREGNVLNVFDICREIVDIAPVGLRYNVLELCLNVAKANGSVVSEELNMLRDMSFWLEVDSEKFRTMMEKILPISIMKDKDVEAILGVTSDMNPEYARVHLNKEYAKWNSRVTNSDPQIQSQADQMLKLIAEARTQYVKK
jgi:hypothetical protein